MKFWIYYITSRTHNEMTLAQEEDNNEGQGFSDWVEAYEAINRTDPLNGQVVGFMRKIPPPYKLTYQQNAQF